MQEKSINNSNFFDRILQIIDLYKIKNINDFALNHLGYKSSQKINRLKEENTSPSFEILKDISNKFVDIDANWLLTGKGDMLKAKNHYGIDDNPAMGVSEPSLSVYNLKTDYFNQDKQMIPLFDYIATAGLVSIFHDNPNNVPLDYISIPNAPKCDGAIFVRGDSMYPILKAGDIICYKMIQEAQNIRFGEIYLLDIDDGDDQYLTVKYIQRSELGDKYFKLVSQNIHHDPKDEKVSNIRAMAIVKVSIRYNTIS